MKNFKVTGKSIPESWSTAATVMSVIALDRLIGKDAREKLDLRVRFKHHHSEGEAVVRDASLKSFDVIVDSYRITQDAWGREYHEDERISKLMQVLAHELSHVKQYIVGDLQTKVSGFAIWKGERFSPEDLQSYFDLPFEKEARGEEEGHMFAFLQRYTELQKEGIV
tara:strand:+ start:300 stop:800 length:501 start_codon:yes stop_codon:yes gene_type:complete